MAASHEHRSAAPRSSPDRGVPWPPRPERRLFPISSITTVNLQIPSAENYPLQRVAEQQSKSLILSSFNQPPERGAHPGPLKPTEASSLGHSLPNRPRTLVLANGVGSAERVPFSPDSGSPRPSPNPSENRPPEAPEPFPGQPLLPSSPTTSLPKCHQSQQSRSLSPPRASGPPPPSPGSLGPAPELRARATTPHPPRAPARAASPRRPALTGEAHDIMEH